VTAPSEGERERDVVELARRIAELGGRQRARVFRLNWWSDRLLAHSMADPVFRTRLFRFVDTFPALRDDEDVQDHLHAEFAGVEVPPWFGKGLGLSERVPGGAHLSAVVVRRGIDRMARQFVVGTTPAEVAAAATALWRRHTATTVDLLGEHTHSEADAQRYAVRMATLVEALAAAAQTWPDDDLLEADDLGRVPRASVSVKVTALAPAFDPLCAEEGMAQAEERLLPILRTCAERGVSVWFDTERYDTKALCHRLFRRLLERPELAHLHAGIVVQAYLRDAAEDLEELAQWASGRAIPTGVRLVKGAYWDTETVDCAAKGWPAPVFERKADTDANYERMVRRLHEHHGTLRAAFATHNLRSIAVAAVEARHCGVPDNGYELQLLYGMAEPVHEALRRMGARLRVYAPMGELVPGMAYLVRRLLENTSNESFVRHHFAEGEALGELLAPPDAGVLDGPPPPVRRPPTDPACPAPYRPEPPAEWRRTAVLEEFRAAVEAEFARPTRSIDAYIGGEWVAPATSSSPARITSVDPARPDDVVAEAAACGGAEVADAVSCARRAAEGWRRVPAFERAAVALRAAEVLRRRRAELGALEVREAGKPWAEADAEVCEAIDFCEYYGRRMLALDAGGEVGSPPGEENRLLYGGRGVAAVIAPWNFPLAITTGMTVAALVTGNAVVLKPAEQTPAVAAELVGALVEAGVPPGVLGFVPGLGEEAGAALVDHPHVDVIVFTGSRAVGLGIVERAARTHLGRRSVARVIAEMGGKNAVVVDADADLDAVVPAVVASAFGFSGQKCSAASRLVVADAVHDELVARVVEAARSLVVGPPRHPGSQVGPVVDAEAHARLTAARARAGEVGTVVLARDDVPGEGWFVGPTVVADVERGSWLATDELFGPVLATFRVPDLDTAIEVANETDYALTAGVFSRSDEHVRRATAELLAGNVYVNRAITGAVVGRQPFGGNGLSGVGSKAGGPDYLLQFCDPKVVSENTVRQGFAPLEG
jgi:RHH-type proline utilization regulon transcriptional repressor/proline dehydrogenase/delta 1-pyrroline-5-carboxylate dehydrogenase